MSEDEDTEEGSFETELTETFLEYGADRETAVAAAERAAAFRADHEPELTAEEVRAALEAVTTEYEAFEHRYDYAIGDLAAANEDCTDSRAYRLAGFDDLAADPEQGA
jgi:hypothetical protein